MEEVECAKCECCGLREDCTRDYILGVRAAFGGRWLCGLCSEAVRDEAARGRTKQHRGGGGGGAAAAAAAAGLEEALRDHMAFCGKCRRSPASRPGRRRHAADVEEAVQVKQATATALQQLIAC